MLSEQLPEAVIGMFRRYYEKLLGGGTGRIPEETISPISAGELPVASSLNGYRETGVANLGRTAMLKLNGGMGTSMGLAAPKSLLRVKNGLSFLDITANQVLAFNLRHGTRIPLVLMNSISTEAESLALLDRYPGLSTAVPRAFLQHKFPRIMADTLEPASFPSDRELEWNPPGHGELYSALAGSGMLDELLDAGIHYLFVSNCDNLGATLDVDLLGYFAAGQFSFVMEVAERTAMDRKGGHCARLKNGRIVLRESAQCPAEEMLLFQDINRHRYFNTNNIWINLPYLKARLAATGGDMELPLIVNPKPLDPRTPSSPRVLQLESAMGSAISIFDNTQAVVVDRMRFIPVKKCDDLLNIRSDRYLLADDFTLQKNTACRYWPLTINLDPTFYSLLNDFELRFPGGAPSFAESSSFEVRGDIKFGKGIICKESVLVENTGVGQKTVADGSILSGTVAL
jgi:UTP--glucose-1-phosphate uridylyltransferase